VLVPIPIYNPSLIVLYDSQSVKNAENRDFPPDYANRPPRRGSGLDFSKSLENSTARIKDDDLSNKSDKVKSQN